MKKTIVIVVILLALLLVGLPVITRCTNCGGNSAALAYTAQVATYVSMAIENRQTEAPTAFSSLVPPSSWPEVFQFGWGVKSYWVRKDITPSETGPIVVCAQCFGNVPQPTVWNLYRRNPSFAAGFLRARSRLLHMTEYNSLDFNEYHFVKEEDVSNQQVHRTQ